MDDEQARRYHEAGWHPLPLPPGMKGPPPEGRTGYGGNDMTLDEILATDWSGNIGLRMPLDVIGLDVDVYRGGNRTLQELLASCGPLPNTWISHSGRNDGSGIRFYRVPMKLSWVAGLAGMDIIQRTHRYAAVWPSLHPDGRQYGWFDQSEASFTTDDVPLVEDLPELPWPWIRELSRAQQADTEEARSFAVGESEVAEFVDAHEQQDAPSYIATILAHFLSRWKAGYSRHDTMQHCLIWAMECVRAGIAAARPTLNDLGELWVDAVRPDARRAELWSDRRTTEFEAMLRHAIGKVNAKSDAEMLRLHDDIAGIPFNVPPPPPPPPPNGDQATGDQEEPPAGIPLITFRDLPDPYVIPSISWHAEELLCRDTHGELAGAEKSLKSYTGLALDVGLAAGLDVLGHFPVPERQRVLILVGEGGEGPFLRRLAEVCHGYGIAPGDLRGWLRFTTDHASASSVRFLEGIQRELETFGPALVHADPWYTYQPSAVESGQLTSVGYALDAVGELCRGGGATALINHHFNRGANGGLRQITGAGHAEWVDSWLLSQHRVPPNLSAGIYKLRLDVGSRQWGGGSWDVDYTITPLLGQMRWDVTVHVDDPSSTVDPLTDYKLELLRVGRRMKRAQTKSAWIQRAKGDDKKLRPAFDELLADGQIVPGTTAKTFEVAP